MDNPSIEETARHDIIVIGASAGGIEALKRIVPHLPADLPAAIFVVVHVLPHVRSYLPDILSHARIQVDHAVDGSPIETGRIYIAPPNCHMVVESGRMHLHSGPTENRHRPAINPLFRSAALAYGPRVIGVILTGNLDDGTAGLWEVKRRGGVAVVQDPGDALYSGMPQSAIANVAVDFIVKLDELPQLLLTLSARVTKGAIGVKADTESRPTRLTCPECRGPLDEQQMGRLSEFRCRVGHVYAPATLVAAHAETVERTLWASIVALEESAELARHTQSALPVESERLRLEEKTKRGMAERLRAMVTELAGQNIGEDNR
jgi:two-component system chemotaxis response regulator CheB